MLLMVRNGRGGNFRVVSGNYIAPKLTGADNLLVAETATIKFLSPFAPCESELESNSPSLSLSLSDSVCEEEEEEEEVGLVSYILT